MQMGKDQKIDAVFHDIRRMLRALDLFSKETVVGVVDRLAAKCLVPRKALGALVKSMEAEDAEARFLFSEG